MAYALRYLILTLCCGGVLSAVEPAPAGAQAVRFTVFSPRAVNGLTFTSRPGQAPKHLVLYPTARSPRYDYLGSMPLRITDAQTNTVVAEATVPREITSALLLLVPLEPAPAAGLRYQTYVLDDTAARQPAGTLAIINFSGLELAGTIDGKPLALTAGLNAATPLVRSAALTLRATVKNRTYQAYAGNVELGKNERALLLLLPPFYRGSLEVQSRLLIDAPGGIRGGAGRP
jgi:hypothetical protein